MARFQKGQSGNPGGRPKAADGLREAVDAHTPAAVAVLAEIMNNPLAQAAARVRAAEILLKKSMPDLSSVDMSAHVENHNYELSDELPTAEEWEAKYAAH